MPSARTPRRRAAAFHRANCVGASEDPEGERERGGGGERPGGIPAAEGLAVVGWLLSTGRVLAANVQNINMLLRTCGCIIIAYSNSASFHVVVSSTTHSPSAALVSSPVSRAGPRSGEGIPPPPLYPPCQGGQRRHHVVGITRVVVSSCASCYLKGTDVAAKISERAQLSSVHLQAVVP